MNELDIIRFRHSEVNFEAAFYDHQKNLKMFIKYMFLSNLDGLLWHNNHARDEKLHLAPMTSTHAHYEPPIETFTT